LLWNIGCENTPGYIVDSAREVRHCPAIAAPLAEKAAFDAYLFFSLPTVQRIGDQSFAAFAPLAGRAIV